MRRPLEVLRRVAATLVAFAGAWGLAGCADDGGTDASATSTTAPSATTTTAPSGGDGGSADAVSRVVTEYIEALGEGDLEAAWELVAEPSREDLGGFGAFVELRTALAEGYGAWASAEERSIETVELEEPPEAVLAVLSGTVALEGPAMEHVTSLVVRTGGGEARVSPFEDALPDHEAVVFEPTPGSSLEAGAAVRFGAPAGVDVAALAGGTRPVGADVVDRGATTVTYEAPIAPVSPDADLAALVVVATDESGNVASFSAGYSVGGQPEPEPEPQSAEEVARAFVDAWRAGDDDALAELGEPDAVAAAHAAAAAADAGWTFERCEGAAGSVYCSWTSAEGTAVVRVRNVGEPRLVMEFRVE